MSWFINNLTFKLCLSSSGKYSEDLYKISIKYKHKTIKFRINSVSSVM
jgi:hypothetical protein